MMTTRAKLKVCLLIKRRSKRIKWMFDIRKLRFDKRKRIINFLLAREMRSSRSS